MALKWKVLSNTGFGHLMQLSLSLVLRNRAKEAGKPRPGQPLYSGRSAGLRPNSQKTRAKKGKMGTASLQTLWTCLPAARPVDTFVMDTEVSLGEADVVVLVLGAPGARQRRLVLINRRVQALQAPTEFLLSR